MFILTCCFSYYRTLLQYMHYNAEAQKKQILKKTRQGPTGRCTLQASQPSSLPCLALPCLASFLICCQICIGIGIEAGDTNKLPIPSMMRRQDSKSAAHS